MSVKPKNELFSCIIYCVSLLILIPTIISYTPPPPRWDETSYLYRAVSFAVYIWHGNFKLALDSVTHVNASPLMGFMGAPWGFVKNILWLVNLTTFNLTLITLLCIVFCFYLLVRLKVPSILVFLSSLSVAFNTISIPCEYFSDELLAWIVLAILLITILEISYEERTPRERFIFAALYGFIIGFGTLTKISFGYFAVTSMLVCLSYKLFKNGWAHTRNFFLTTLLFALPALSLLAFSLQEQINYARYVNSHQIAQYYAWSGAKSFFKEILRVFSYYGSGKYFLLALLFGIFYFPLGWRFLKFRLKAGVGLLILFGSFLSG